jgi:hypothetical protein
MKYFDIRLVLGATVSLTLLAGCSSVPRIDGSSDGSFERSHTKLMQSLTPSDQLRLLLAEGLIMEPRGCLTTEPVPGNPLLTDALGGQAVLRTCRKELDGLSFDDIMLLAYPEGP